ncbi:transposase [Roseomonas sp. GCM10028921]
MVLYAKSKLPEGGSMSPVLFLRASSQPQRPGIEHLLGKALRLIVAKQQRRSRDAGSGLAGSGGHGEAGSAAGLQRRRDQCGLTLKVLLGLPLRAAQGLVGSLLRLMGLDWPVPHSSTLSRRRRDVTVVIPYRPRGEPLQLDVDRTGVKVPGEGSGG